MENNNKPQVDSQEESAKQVELEELVSLIKSVQKDGISTVVVYSRKGRIEIYNGLIDNLYIIASRLNCIANNETNEQIRQHRIKMQQIVQPHGRIITN